MSDKHSTLDQTSAVLFRRLIREGVKPYFGTIGAALFCMALVAGSTALLAWLIKPVVDWVFLQKSHALLWPVGGAVLLTSLVKGLAGYAQSNLMSHLGLRVISDMQKRLFHHLVGMDLRFFQDRPIGTLVSRFTNDISVMRATVSTALVGLGQNLLSTIFLIGVMFYQDWKLAIVAFILFPLAVQPIVRLGKRMRRVTANTQHHIGLFTSLLEQSFQGMRVVKAYGMEHYEESRLSGIIETVFKLTYKSARVGAASSPIMETLGGFAAGGIVIYGGSQVISGSTTPGAFFSFLAAVMMAYQPMKALANLNTNLQAGLAATQRLFDLLDIDPTITDAVGAVPLAIQGGAVRFENVSFGYGGPILAVDNLSITVPPGRKAALVGSSGGGKSTIINLIPRFYDITAGQIIIDGQDAHQVTLESLRAHIALVSQDVNLFDDTVRANIAYGRPDASFEEIEEAARNAAAHDFITALPNGYDTLVGENGTRLSGGQRQRLAIARAMLKNAPILLLDEATSALDSESERQVQAALERLMRGRTTLVVAHRLSTIVDSDVIFVIDKGRLVEQGRHAELIARGGHYARLHALQAIEEPAPAPKAALARA